MSSPRTARSRSVLLAAVLACALLAGPWPRPAQAAERWEQEVERAVRRQDREMKSAQARRGSLTDVVRRYEQLLLREATARNDYLLGRVLYYAKRPDEAIPRMLRALQREPRFYFADLALAIIYMEQERVADAERHVASLRSKKPDHVQGLKLEAELRMKQQDFPKAYRLVRRVLELDRADPDARRAMAICLFRMKEWKRAATALRLMVTQDPRDVNVRRMLVECQLQQEDWKSAEEGLRLMLRAIPEDPVLLWQHGLTLYKLERKEEAAITLERLDRLRPGTEHVLQLLQAIYWELEKVDRVVSVLERMRPLVEGDPEKARALEQALEALKRGETGPLEAPTWERNPLAELLERCVHPDVEIRRAALHEYFEEDIPFVDPVIYQRYDPRVEPDATCRIWVLRILGRFRVGEVEDSAIVRDVARYAALGLEDPETRVRCVAAEVVGNIGVSAGLLYLLPHLTGMPLEELPADPQGRSALENEFNATRQALVKLTGHQDVPIGATNWVRAESMAAARKDWVAWLDGAEGVRVRLEALEELGRVEGVDPRWPLRYVLVDVIRAAPDPVALESYRLLRRGVEALGAQADADPWWRTFPRVTDAELTEERLPALRERMRAWWKALPRRTPTK